MHYFLPKSERKPNMQTENKTKANLWNKNFLCLALGTVFSAMGGIGLNVAMSMVVFDQTQSTLLSAIFMVASGLPSIIVPLIMGPIVDRRNPLKLLIKNELLLAAIFFAAGCLIYFTGFQYIFFLLLSVLISVLGVISGLASGSINPQVISRENYLKGNAVINTIYPLLNIVIIPLATLLFQKFGISLIFIAYSFLTVLDVLVESRMDVKFEYKPSEARFSLKEYKHDLKDGLRYFTADPAIRSVFLFFSLVMFADAASSLIYPFFQTTPGLNRLNYATYTSIKSAGYMVGGFLHYFINIKSSHRFKIAVVVYFLFVLLDSLLLFTPLPVMCLIGFILGIAGMNSANIRVSAVAARVDNAYRGKINSLFTVMVTVTNSAGQLIAGSLAESIPYPYIVILFQAVYCLGILVFMLPRKNKVRELYNYETE